MSGDSVEVMWIAFCVEIFNEYRISEISLPKPMNMIFPGNHHEHAFVNMPHYYHLMLILMFYEQL